MSDSNIGFGTTWYASRRHISVEMKSYGRGRRGYALCASHGRPYLHDQADVDGGFVTGQRSVAVVDLPMCAKCERIARLKGGDVLALLEQGATLSPSAAQGAHDTNDETGEEAR